MSLGATTSAPAWARLRRGAGRADRATDRCRLHSRGGFDDNAAVAVAGVLAKADVGDEDKLLAAADCLRARRPCCTIPLLSQAPEPCSSLLSGRPKSSSPPRPSWAASSASRNGLVDREIEDAGHGGDFAAHAFAGTDETRGRSGRRARGWFRAPAHAASSVRRRRRILVCRESHGDDCRTQLVARASREAGHEREPSSAAIEMQETTAMLRSTASFAQRMTRVPHTLGLPSVRRFDATNFRDLDARALRKA